MYIWCLIAFDIYDLITIAVLPPGTLNSHIGKLQLLSHPNSRCVIFNSISKELPRLNSRRHLDSTIYLNDFLFRWCLLWYTYRYTPPRKLTWQRKHKHLKMYLLSKWWFSIATLIFEGVNLHFVGGSHLTHSQKFPATFQGRCLAFSRPLVGAMGSDGISCRPWKETRREATWKTHVDY